MSRRAACYEALFCSMYLNDNCFINLTSLALENFIPLLHAYLQTLMTGTTGMDTGMVFADLKKHSIRLLIGFSYCRPLWHENALAESGLPQANLLL